MKTTQCSTERSLSRFLITKYVSFPKSFPFPVAQNAIYSLQLSTLYNIIVLMRLQSKIYLCTLFVLSRYYIILTCCIVVRIDASFLRPRNMTSASTCLKGENPSVSIDSHRSGVLIPTTNF